MARPATGPRLRAVRSAMSPAEWTRLAAMFALILA
jgi:hypothetical protein